MGRAGLEPATLCLKDYGWPVHGVQRIQTARFVEDFGPAMSSEFTLSGQYYGVRSTFGLPIAWTHRRRTQAGPGVVAQRVGSRGRGRRATPQSLPSGWSPHRCARWPRLGPLTTDPPLSVSVPPVGPLRTPRARPLTTGEDACRAFIDTNALKLDRNPNQLKSESASLRRAVTTRGGSRSPSP
jgi:hypothetical protein